MTREDLCRVLEEFAIATIATTQTELTADEQCYMISSHIETLADTVMVCSKRDALRYSVN